MQTLSNNLWLFKIYFKKGRKNKKKFEKKIEKKKNCENSKLFHPRYLGYFFHHRTMIIRALGNRRLFATG
jgi:hypothetical protein